MAQKALEGVRVLDLSSVVMGPYAAQILGDFGADVIKIEPPAGDSTRWTGPAAEAGMSSLFLGVNRNKRSVVVDLKSDAGRDALLVLVRTADVLIHNMRSHKMVALGLGYAALSKINPRLIYAELVGFGPGGPYSGLPAYDDTIQGMSGLAALCKLQTGEPGYFPTIAADKTSALFAVNAILAALLQRSRTDEGARVEVAMFESMVGFNLVEHLYGCHFDPPLSPPGYPRVLAPWRKPYRTTDGHICLMPYTDRHWGLFFEAAGHPRLATDERFQDIAARTANIGELYKIAGRFIARRSTTDWLEICGRLEIPAMPIATLDEILVDPHLQATGFFHRKDDPHMGTIIFPGCAAIIDGVRSDSRMPPRLGEHTAEVLAKARGEPSISNAVAADANIGALRGGAGK